MLMKDTQKLIKLLERVSGKKVKLVESYNSNLSNTLNTLISDAKSNWISREKLTGKKVKLKENNDYINSYQELIYRLSTVIDGESDIQEEISTFLWDNDGFWKSFSQVEFENLVSKLELEFEEKEEI